MKHLLDSLQDKIKQIEKGDSTVFNFDEAISQSQELLEKLYILRYKAYEKELGDKTPKEEIIEGSQREFDLSEINAPNIETVEELPLEQAVVEKEGQAKAEENISENTEEILESINEEIKESLDIPKLIKETEKPAEALDTLIGSFSLKEKLQYINQLFGGSSEVFASAIKQLDESGSMKKAEPHLVYLAHEYNWIEAEEEVIKKIIAKVCARYANKD